MWYEQLTDDDRAILNKLAGKLNLPSLCKYQSNAHFLSEVYSKITEAHSLARQINRLLGKTLQFTLSRYMNLWFLLPQV